MLRYKEEWSLFRETIAAAQACTYPADKLHIYICDDGRADPVRVEVEEEFGKGGGNMPRVSYLQRPDGTHAKAGNLNHALKHSRGQLVAVLDADHVATKDFLTSVVPHLLDFDQRSGTWVFGKTALVQTKQHFNNTDKLICKLTDADNDLFTSLSQMGFNGCGAGLCCGKQASDLWLNPAQQLFA